MNILLKGLLTSRKAVERRDNVYGMWKRLYGANRNLTIGTMVFSSQVLASIPFDILLNQEGHVDSSEHAYSIV